MSIFKPLTKANRGIWWIGYDESKQAKILFLVVLLYDFWPIESYCHAKRGGSRKAAEIV
jgi:hypothetical protein